MIRSLILGTVTMFSVTVHASPVEAKLKTCLQAVYARAAASQLSSKEVLKLATVGTRECRASVRAEIAAEREAKREARIKAQILKLQAKLKKG